MESWGGKWRVNELENKSSVYERSKEKVILSKMKNYSSTKSHKNG